MVDQIEIERVKNDLPVLKEDASAGEVRTAERIANLNILHTVQFR